MDNSKVDNIVELAATLAGKASDIQDVIVIFTDKKGRGTSLDNSIEVGQALFLIESFKHQLLSAINTPQDSD